MKTFFLLFTLLFSASITQAQTIHGHSQKSSYANESEYQDISDQCHWLEPNKLVAHLHFDTKSPIYSEINHSLLRIPFTIKLFQTDGTATFPLDRQELVTKIEWDETGSETAPIMKGDPASHALKQWTGHLTIDPNRNVGGHGFPQKGWYSPQIEVHINFPSGANVNQVTRLPFYSMLDPNAPDGSLSGLPLLIASCYPHSGATDEWGTNYVEVDNYLPLLPINADWPLIVATASYGGRNIGDGLFEQRVDLDLHNDIAGRILSSQPESGFTSANRAPILSPSIMGPGSHKSALMWFKPTLDNKEVVTTLLVVNTPVGTSTPPVLVTVPTVVGQSITSATSTILANSLAIGSVTTVVSDSPLDQVISQNPIAGTSVSQGTTINLVKSAGPVSTGNWENFTPTFQRMIIPGQPTRYRICETNDQITFVCKEIQ